MVLRAAFTLIPNGDHLLTEWPRGGLTAIGVSVLMRDRYRP